MRTIYKQNGQAYLKPTPERLATVLSFSWMAWVDGMYIPKKTPLISHRVRKVEHVNYA
jgi:hypothetical protein